jgi:signal transduction histidine kinase
MSDAPTSPAPPADRPDSDLPILGAIAQEILGAMDLETLLWRIVSVVGREFDLPYVTLALLEEGGRLAFRAAYGTHRDNETFYRERRDQLWLPPGRGVSGRAVQLRQTLVVADVTAFPDHVAVDFLPETRSEVAVPIQAKGHVLGVIDAQSPRVDGFTARDVFRLEQVVPLIAVAIENAVILARLKERQRALTLTAATSRLAVGARSAAELAREVCLRLRESFGVEAAALYVPGDTEGVLERLGQAGDPTSPVTVPEQVRADAGLIGRVLGSGCTLVFDAAVEPDRGAALSVDGASEIATPLLSGGKVIGALALLSRRPGHFTAEDGQVLEAVSGPLAHGLASVQALSRIATLRNDLSGMVVHDVRNPLMVILAALRTLERLPAVQADDRCRRYLRNAGVAGDEILRLVTGLLDIEKLESGAIALHRTAFQVGDAMHRVIESNRILAEVQEITLTVTCAPELPAVVADLELFLRTLENLLANALKFTPAGGEVCVACRAATAEELQGRLPGAAAGVLIEVADTGPGIPENAHAMVFEKFGVVESRRLHGKVSTGLGLAFCKLVVTAHGGALWLESTEGEGSRFRMIWPVEPPG